MKTFLFVLAAVLATAGFTSSMLVPSGFSATSAASAAESVAYAPAPDGVVTFSPDRSHSRVGFRVRHLGISHVRGSFNDFDAVVTFDPENIRTLSVRATVQTASIDTDQERRDNHLRSDDFFNAEQYPELTFVSKEVRNLDGNRFELVGDLTLRDVTKEVVFDTEFMGIGAGRNGLKAGFEARTTINRFDYGLKWDRLTEAGGLVVSEDVEIQLEMELDEVVPEG